MSTGAILILVIFMVVLPATFYFLTKQASNKKVQAFLEQHPDAVKVYLPGLGMSGVHAVSVALESVDGEKPLIFMEGMKTGFYVLPGKHTLEATATKTRAGVLHKSVSTVFGPFKHEVQVEAYKIYQFGFDGKEEVFTFSEKN